VCTGPITLHAWVTECAKGMRGFCMDCTVKRLTLHHTNLKTTAGGATTALMATVASPKQLPTETNST
jgi:hypothetical protein